MNTLELEINSKEAATLAVGYESKAKRKETYLKCLILKALEKHIDSVQTDNSLFWIKGVYGLTGICDFYVHNNLFDVVVLEQYSNELLFNIIDNDFRSNVAGYVVTRVSEDFKSIEVLGYFTANEFADVISNGKLDRSAIREINDFEDIEIMEAQMSLSDVDERFFALVSEFCDKNISKESSSELLCLLYNSLELREAFSDIAKFENVCSAMKKHSDLVQDDLLTVLAGNKDESLEDDFVFDDFMAADEDEEQAIVFESEEKDEEAQEVVEEKQPEPEKINEQSQDLILENDSDDLIFFDDDGLVLEEQDEEETKKEKNEIKQASTGKLKLELVEEPEEKIDEELVLESEEVLIENEVPEASAPIEIDDELMSILNESSDEEGVVVSDEELFAILGMNNDDNYDSKDYQICEDEEMSMDDLDELENNDEKGIQEKVQTSSEPDLEVLYKAGNSPSTNSFPGVGLVNSRKGPDLNKFKVDKKVAVAAALVVVLGAVGVVNMFTGKGNSEKTDMALNDNNMVLPPVNNEMGAMPQDVMNTPQMPVQNTLPEPVKAENDSKIVSSLSQQAGAAPVILKSVAWQVPASISNDVVFNRYLQIAGKNIKLNLASDLLTTDDFAYNNQIKVSMTVKNNAPVSNIKVSESSGSKAVDDIVLQSIKQTLKYINSPVMSTDSGNREVVLVISI